MKDIKRIEKLKPGEFNTRIIKDAVKAYLMAKVYAELMREELDRVVYVPALFIDGRPLYKYAEKWKTRGERFEKEYITNPDHSYLMEDEDFQDYHAECQHQIKKRALTDSRYKVKPDCCPALVADSLRTSGEWAIITAVKDLTGIDEGDLYGLDMRKKYLDLIIGLVVTQSPEYFEKELIG